MNEKRQLFLDESWAKYPEFPISWEAGKLIQIVEKAEGFILSLERDFKRFSHEVLKLRDYDSFDLNQILVPGDILAVKDTEVILLTPAMHELRVPNFTRDTALAWSKFIKEIRAFFDSQSFVEIATPTLVSSPGMEVFLESFATEWLRGSSKEKLYLPTSPEFHLKKALCQGFDKIFEIAKVYRNNESGHHHQNEFWMLEWYRAYSNLQVIEEDLIQLISNFDSSAKDYERKSFAELFAEHFDFTLSPVSSREDLQRLCKEHSIEYSESDDFDDLFFRLYLEKIEPQFEKMDWLVVHSFPPSQAALARLNSEGWADRFEIYYKGIELANAFHELNDPALQEARFLEAIEQKKQKGLEVVPYDKDLIRAMKSGLPPSGGIALGLDRLFMVLNGIKKIEETRLFPR